MASKSYGIKGKKAVMGDLKELKKHMFTKQPQGLLLHANVN